MSEDWFKLYEDGKHRRYTLLFSVNGGAFAIAQLMLNKDGAIHGLGNLTLSELSLGMVAFTVIMVVDIFSFGVKMRERMKPAMVFDKWGKSVLISIGSLICLGWLRAGL